eukprot:NODE_3754_length_907_cov_24.012821_g3601_i0.p1 GENE.NODE_3754_length_907_cov_24.012821_g3601_i0~~NODE_3754_length_907_cov_24.012821_g3601_i0.p1  ORF type:complete len:260 (+),score=46.85 NODE_3754_length_907_cov_24.012821_g3601_i0:56-835(+)
MLRQTCSKRLSAELCQLLKEPLPGIAVYADDSDLTSVTAVVVGPKGTPYEGGLFHFALKFPRDYPFSPPAVQFLTTDGGQVRFNPNLYANGRVCLSILGTWTGPCWQPSQTLSTVLLSLQTILNTEPYRNEPGFEEEVHVGDVQRYNQRVQYETLRVAVCDALEAPTVTPPSLLAFMETTFLSLASTYLQCAAEGQHLDCTSFDDPFREMHGRYHYAQLVPRLQRLQERLQHRAALAKEVELDPVEELESEEELEELAL